MRENRSDRQEVNGRRGRRRREEKDRGGRRDSRRRGEGERGGLAGIKGRTGRGGRRCDRARRLRTQRERRRSKKLWCYYKLSQITREKKTENRTTVRQDEKTNSIKKLKNRSMLRQ